MGDSRKCAVPTLYGKIISKYSKLQRNIALKLLKKKISMSFKKLLVLVFFVVEESNSAPVIAAGATGHGSGGALTINVGGRFLGIPAPGSLGKMPLSYTASFHRNNITIH